jgi:stage II sporulation protein D
VSSIRVLLANGKGKLTISSTKSITVEDGNGVDHMLPAGKTVFTPALELAVDGGPKQALAPPLTFSPASGMTLTLGRPYRGQILVDVVSGKLRAINIVPLEQYLYGVVASEMPSSWLPAALEAQAVAARSYALASRRAAAPFDVYADGRSQAYLGVSAEKPTATQAVDETAGEVLLYNGQVATTLFSSSTGGRTQSAADAFGPPGRPYLVSVQDPYDTISPYHSWGPVAVTGKTLGSALRVAGRIVDATVTRNPSRRVRAVKIASLLHGTQVTTSAGGGATQSALGLRSTRFSVGVLSHHPP